MKHSLTLAAIVCFAVHASATGAPLGIVVSSDTGAGTSELLYYGTDATFLGDTVNRAGQFTSLATGDFDGDGEDEIVTSRYVAATPESDLYYYEFGASNLYFDTRNRLVRYNAVATGNFDADPVAEVVVARQSGSGVAGDLFETELLFFQPGEQHPYLDSTNDDGRFIAPGHRQP